VTLKRAKIIFFALVSSLNCQRFYLSCIKCGVVFFVRLTFTNVW